ncbi:CaiB/BaiF CoA transferase family protein [Candidatus Entotheonella palauensis]|nr:CoA transferase [Candidatus Entotheonella palauensis]
MPTSADNDNPTDNPASPYSGPMSGVRVLDLGVWVAGPFAATLLADFGAEVIKIERPGLGDPMRYRGTMESAAAHWCMDGRNKKSMTLDLSTERGQDILAQLIGHADVLIDNHRPGMLDAWGFTEARIRSLNPGLIVSTVSGFGQNGPYAHRLAFDRIAAAMGGLLYLNGEADRPPVRTGVIISDYVTALFNAIGILMALYHRDAKGGGGERMDVAMYECIFRILENTLGAYDKMGIHRQRMGNITPGFYPDDMFETLDGKWVVLSAVSDQQFAALCGVIGRAELAHDPALATLNDRGRQVERLQSVIGAWVRATPSREVVAQLEAARVPCALVMGIDDIVDDPHYRARNAIIEVEDPQYGTLKHPAVTPRLSYNPGAVHRGAPTLGADTDAILRDILALSETDIAELHRQQIV